MGTRIADEIIAFEILESNPHLQLAGASNGVEKSPVRIRIRVEG